MQISSTKTQPPTPTTERICEAGIYSRTQLKVNGVATTAGSMAKRKQKRCLAKQMEQLESELHKALAVMDLTTSKMMNYRQLIQSEKHSKNFEHICGKQIW